MAAQLQLDHDTVATFRDGGWECTDEGVLEWLVARQQYLDLSPAVERFDLELARDAAAQLGGEARDLGEDPVEKGRVY